MIPIDNSANRLSLLAQEYLTEVRTYFGLDASIKRKDKLEPLFRGKRSLEWKMLKIFHTHLDRIILAGPDTLASLNSEMWAFLNINPDDAQHERKMVIFRKRMEHYYSDFFSLKIIRDETETTIGRWLSAKIDMKVCPYCNHNYTLTVNRKPGGIRFRPDFDHFYPKSVYPLLALSFFNLIPSCTVCNKLKGSKEIRFSPYQPECADAIVFKLYGLDANGDESLLGLGEHTGKIAIRPVYRDGSTALGCNIGNLGIAEVYEHQTDFVQEILDKAQEYNKDSYHSMVENFKGLGRTEAEIDRIIWSAYLDDQSRRPLSKLTSDLLIQLGIKK